MQPVRCCRKLPLKVASIWRVPPASAVFHEIALEALVNPRVLKDKFGTKRATITYDEITKGHAKHHLATCVQCCKIWRSRDRIACNKVQWKWHWHLSSRRTMYSIIHTCVCIWKLKGRRLAKSVKAFALGYASCRGKCLPRPVLSEQLNLSSTLTVISQWDELDWGYLSSDDVQSSFNGSFFAILIQLVQDGLSVLKALLMLKRSVTRPVRC